MRSFIFGVALLLSVYLPVMASTNMTVTYTELGSIHKATYAWNTTNAACPDALTNFLYATGTSKWLAGRVHRGVLESIGNGTGANVTVTIQMDDGIKIASLVVVATNSTPASFIYGNPTNGNPWVFNSTLALTVTNCAATNQVSSGTFSIFYEP